MWENSDCLSNSSAARPGSAAGRRKRHPAAMDDAQRNGRRHGQQQWQNHKAFLEMTDHANQRARRNIGGS